jgi:periplasmic divalent cation tolerance protein
MPCVKLPARHRGHRNRPALASASYAVRSDGAACEKIHAQVRRTSPYFDTTDSLGCMANFTQVVTTEDTEEKAARLARGIVDARLAACVQIVGPIKSLYWWQGALEEAREWQLVIKTTSDRLAELETHIKGHHSYETPEITATDIQWGSREYLDWISAETRTDA